MADKRPSQHIKGAKLAQFFWHNAAVVGITMSTTLIFAFATLYLKNQIGVSNFLVGVAISLSHVITVFISPLAGTLSDKAKTPWGRRRPFLVGGSLIAAVFLVILPHVDNYLVFLLTLSFFFVFSVGYQIPFYALIPDMAPEGQRGVYSTFTGLLRLAGAGIIMGVGGALWDAGAVWPFYVTAVFVVGTSFVTAFSVREEPAIELPEADTVGFFKHLGPYVKDLWGHRRILVFFAAQFMWWMGLGALMPFATIMLDKVYGIKISELAKVTPIIVLAGIFLVASIIYAGILGDRRGHRFVIVSGLCIMTLGCVAAFFVRSMPFVYVAATLIAIGAAPLFNEPFAMLAELVPRGREGEFYGLDTISITLSQVPASMLGGAVSDLFGYTGLYLFVALCAVAAVGLMAVQAKVSR
jgi:MFS family permease